jgi:hypothetical protein
MPSDGNDAALLRVFEMTMAAACPRQVSPIAFHQFDCVADFHCRAAYKRIVLQSTSQRPNETELSHRWGRRAWQTLETVS